MMAFMQKKHEYNDWCHICGGRSNRNVEIWYPENAEHSRMDRPSRGGDTQFLRICASCGEDIRRVGVGEIEKVIADRPGLYKKDKHPPAKQKI
jgi:hypothetical protein